MAPIETVSIDEAMARPPQLLVSRSGKPLLRITRLEASNRRISFGLLKDKVTLRPTFDASSPDAVAANFEGR